MIDHIYSLSGVWHWETVEIHTSKKGWQITREYAPGDYTWEFSDEGTVTYRLSFEYIITRKYKYRLHEMLRIYNEREDSGEWWTIEWLTTDTIMMCPSDKNDPFLRRVKLRRGL